MVVEHFTYMINKGVYIKGNDFRSCILYQYLKKIDKELNRPLKILDVGCGSGGWLDDINRYFPNNELYGIDITPRCIEYARKNRSQKINFKITSVFDLPFVDNTFDVVISENLLHHLVGKNPKQSKNNAKKALREIMRVTKNKGDILIAEMTMKYRFQSYLLFYISNLFTKLNIIIPSFWLNNVIISFFNSKEFKQFIIKNDINIIEMNKDYKNNPLRFKITLLWSCIDICIWGENNKVIG